MNACANIVLRKTKTNTQKEDKKNKTPKGTDVKVRLLIRDGNVLKIL